MYQQRTRGGKNQLHRQNNRRSFNRRGRGRRQGSFNPVALIQLSKQQAQVNVSIKKDTIKNSFDDFNLSDNLKRNIKNKGYQIPTPIQDKIINHILNHQDVVGLASTGTGKTAAFLIPLINTVFQKKQTNNKPNRVLIMAPTRELAIQIEDEFRYFAKNMQVYSTLCIGGANINRQIASLKRSPQFVIGTPGRLIDLEKRNIFNLNTFSVIVLDEVDQMLDMGFINDIKYVVNNLPQQRHSLFFSATLPKKLEQVVREFVNNPVVIQVEKQQASQNIIQDIVKINGRAKVNVLHDLLDTDGFDKVLVFGRTKHGLNKLSSTLYERGVKVATIHGNKSQSQRQRALKRFKRNQVQVLLATDIASRGLDIDNVTHVINYDLPQTKEDYIHRIGRTGRANKTGVAISFID